MLPARAAADRGWRVVEDRQDTPLGRWHVVLAFPEGPLAERVEAVWASAGQGVFEVEEILPRTRTEVLFGMGDRHWLRDREDRRRDRPFDASFVSGLQQAPLDVLVRATGYSHRWLTERFRAEVGLAPKAYARVVRFENAFERLGRLDRVHWAEFALDCGYYDQAHLVREFRRLAGATPTEVFRRRAPDGLGLLTEDDAAVWHAPVAAAAGA